MSQRPIVRSPKKEVQKFESFNSFPGDSSQQNYNIRTASVKETLMGFKLTVVITTAGVTANTANLLLYISKNAETRTPSVTAHTSTPMDREVILDEFFAIPAAAGVQTLVIESKQKRKLNQGDIMKFSIINGATYADMSVNCKFVHYIGQ